MYISQEQSEDKQHAKIRQMKFIWLRTDNNQWICQKVAVLVLDSAKNIYVNSNIDSNSYTVTEQ